MKTVLSTFLIFFAFACTTQVDSQTLGPVAFDNQMKAQPGTVIDVRTPDEFVTGHLRDAVNMDFYAADFDAQFLKLDKSKTYYLYCQKGARSKNAMEKFKKKGFTQVYNLKGGINDWVDEGKPVDREAAPEQAEMTVDEYKRQTASFPLVLVDFSATWCGPCKKLSPIVDKIGHDRAKEIKIIKIDVDANSSVARHNSIEEIPTLAFYKDGKIAMRMIGLYSEKQLNETIDKLLSGQK